MPWRYDGGVKCPECDNRATIVTERTVSDGGTKTRYVLKCSSCGHRAVLQEVLVARTGDGLRVRVIAPAGASARGMRSNTGKPKPSF